MSEQLEIVIGANVDDAKAGINSLGQTINQFAQQGKLSIGVLEQSLAQLRAQIKITTDPIEAQKLGQAFKAVQDQINQLKLNDGLSQQLGGVTRATRVAHTELEGVSLELRNLASGNSSAIDSLGRLAFNFQRLGGIAGGAGGALSSIGEALLGPAGLILAFTTLVPLIVSFVGDLLDSESAAEANQKAFEDLNATLADSKKAFEALQTQVKFLDQIGPINLDIQFGKGFQTDLLDLNARVLELNDEILAQQKVFTDARNARSAADEALTDAEINNGKKVIEEKKKQLAEATKAEEDANKQLIDLENERSVLFRKTQQTRTDDQRKQEQQRSDDAKAAAAELNRQLIALAKEAEKAFSIPLRLKFDSTDLDVDKLQKARDILAGIRDFTIKAKIDIALPDIKELPKEQVEKFFKNVPNALQDAVNKGLIEAQGKELKIDLGPFSKEIQAEIDKFNQAGLKIPVTFDLKDADLLIKLRDAFPIEQIQKSVDELKKSLGTEDTFQGFIRDLIKLGDEGQKAFDATAKAALDAGDNITEALRKAGAARESVGGISKEAGEAALVLQQTLAPAFESLFSSILAGQAPLEAFFKTLIQGIDQLIAKLIAAALEALILSSITGGIGGFGGIFKALLGFEKGGDPSPDKPFIAGEKGWELIVPKTSMHVFTHDQSKSILSSSVQQHESIKEYLIAEKISQQVKNHFNTAFRSIESSVRILATNNEKLATYSYQLHNNIQSLKESFVDRSSTDTIQKLNESVNNLKESFVSISDKSTINNSVEKLTETVNNFKESSTDNNRFERLSQAISELKESFVSVIIERLQSTGKESFSDKSSVIEKFASTSTINDRVNNTESFDKIVSLITDNADKQSSSSSIVNNYRESFDKVNTSIKETINYLTASINDKSATIDKSSHYETSFTSSLVSIIDKLHERISTINNSKEIISSLDKLQEKLIEKITIQNLTGTGNTIPLNKFTEKFESFKADKSVHIERIINNNFFSSDLKESFKSMSISDLQRTFNIPAFAQGGAVFGPTLAILGEGFGISRSNPEFVGTASQLKGIQGGQFDVNVSVGGELSFSMGKLAIALNREVRSQLRTNGKHPF